MMKVSTIAVHLALTAVAGMALCGCTRLREAAGITKSAPDEFTVLTKAPLVIPPDFGLMPPKPGAAPTNQADPSSNAQAALYGSDPAAVAANMPGNASMAEKLLLATAGATDADPKVRELLAADATAQLPTDDSFIDDVMFWKGDKKTADDKSVDADAEAKRKAGGPAGAVPPPPPVKAEDKGWFDGWFDWL
jgi:hypothetical protein